jgi:hypothetical protein
MLGFVNEVDQARAPDSPARDSIPELPQMADHSAFQARVQCFRIHILQDSTLKTSVVNKPKSW